MKVIWGLTEPTDPSAEGSAQADAKPAAKTRSFDQQGSKRRKGEDVHTAGEEEGNHDIGLHVL